MRMCESVRVSKKENKSHTCERKRERKETTEEESVRVRYGERERERPHIVACMHYVV